MLNTQYLPLMTNNNNNSDNNIFHNYIRWFAVMGGCYFCLNLSHFLKYLDDLVSLDLYLDDLLLLLFSKKIISLTLFILYNIIKISHHIIFFIIRYISIVILKQYYFYMRLLSLILFLLFAYHEICQFLWKDSAHLVFSKNDVSQLCFLFFLF